jgi:uncharacterized protein (DUF433 family)
MNWRERIVIDPAIHHGKPCVKGTRVPVSVIVGSVAEGHSAERIIESWPQLTAEDIRAALKFAANNPSPAMRERVPSEARRVRVSPRHAPSPDRR